MKIIKAIIIILLAFLALYLLILLTKVISRLFDSLLSKGKDRNTTRRNQKYEQETN